MGGVPTNVDQKRLGLELKQAHLTSQLMTTLPALDFPNDEGFMAGLAGRVDVAKDLRADSFPDCNLVPKSS